MWAKRQIASRAVHRGVDNCLQSQAEKSQKGNQKDIYMNKGNNCDTDVVDNVENDSNKHASLLSHLLSFYADPFLTEKYRSVKPFRDYFRSTVAGSWGTDPPVGIRSIDGNHRVAVSALPGDFFCFSLLTIGSTYATIFPS